MAELFFAPQPQLQKWTWEILNRAPERIHIIDRDGRILFANSFGTLAGEHPPSAGTSIFEFVPFEQHDRVRGVLFSVTTKGLSGNFEAAFTFGQETRWFQTYVIPVGEEDGETNALALFYHEARSDHAKNEYMQLANELEKRLAERNQTLKEYVRYLDAGGKLNIQLTRLNKVSVVLQTLAEQVQLAMNARFTAVFKVENEWIEYAAGVKSPVLIHRRACLDDEGILGQVLRTNSIQFFPQLDDETASHLWRSLPREINIASLIIAPLVCTEAFRGILYLGYSNPTYFEKNDEMVLRACIEATIDTLHRIYVVQQLERNIHAREQEISVLYDLSTYASEPVDPNDLLQKSLRRIMKATRCDTGLVYCFNECGQQEEMVSCWPQTGIPEPVKSFLREGGPKVQHGLGDAYHLFDLPPDKAFTCITVPINRKANSECFLRLFGDPKDFHHAEVVQLIVSAARQLGLSMDSARDRKMAEEAIVLEERQRMARNLHDSITQSLYALALSGDVAKKAFDRHEEERLRTALKDITSSSLQALKEMRLMLFELRPAALEKTGLIEALELRLNTVERRSGMEARLECPDDLKIPEAVEAEVYHVICEALNNSLRHSGARSVRVTIRAAASLLSIEVEDNGKGFELSADKQGGMGLSSMNERARKLGGNFSITSSAGQGTRISLKVKV